MWLQHSSLSEEGTWLWSLLYLGVLAQFQRADWQNNVILLLSSCFLYELPNLPCLLSNPSVPVLITAQQTHLRAALIYKLPCRELPLWKPEYFHFLTQVLKNCQLPVTFTRSFLHVIHFITIAFCTTRILKDWNNFSPYRLNITLEGNVILNLLHSTGTSRRIFLCEKMQYFVPGWVGCPWVVIPMVTIPKGCNS